MDACRSDGSAVKNPPATLETQVRSLGQEDPPEEGVATHSNVRVWESHGQRSLVGYSSWGHKETIEATELTWMSTNKEHNWEATAIIQQKMVVAQHKSN